MESNVIFLADDAMLFSIVNDPVISADELNHDLEVINHLSVEDEVKPSSKNQATKLLFSCKKNNPDHPSLLFNGTIGP